LNIKTHAGAAVGALIGVTQTKADVGLAALPLDVALKMEVQDYFDPWLAAAEDSISFLKEVRLAVAVLGTLPDDSILPLLDLVDESAALAAFSDEVAALTATSIDIRADLTSFYELLLWLTMYRTILEKVTTVKYSQHLPVDKHGKLLNGKNALPYGHLGTMNLLRYLALRFFGMGKIKGKGADAELVFTDEELLAVYEQTEELCAKLFVSDRIAQLASDDPDLDPDLKRAIKQAVDEVRFVVLPYDG
jgi:hypothetical protein